MTFLGLEPTTDRAHARQGWRHRRGRLVGHQARLSPGVQLRALRRCLAPARIRPSTSTAIQPKCMRALTPLVDRPPRAGVSALATMASLAQVRSKRLAPTLLMCSFVVRARSHGNASSPALTRCGCPTCGSDTLYSPHQEATSRSRRSPSTRARAAASVGRRVAVHSSRPVTSTSRPGLGHTLRAGKEETPTARSTALATGAWRASRLRGPGALGGTRQPREFASAKSNC